MIERAKSMMQVHQESMHQALAAGVKVVPGTDAGGYVHGDNAREIELLVERECLPTKLYKLPPVGLLNASASVRTSAPSEVGKLADLLVLDGDP